MATALLAPPATTAPSDDRLYRIPLDRYHAMIGAGLFTPEDRVELLEGVLVETMPTKPPHVYCLGVLFDVLRETLPPGLHLRAQQPITLENSEPEPDLAVVRGSHADYADRHPGLGDIALVVEISDTTLHRDRGWKKRIYATAGIPFYWLVDLNSRIIERYTQPSDGDYAVMESYGEDGSIPAFDSVIAVNGILPPA
jgi:Uma2 family endonuclease